MKAAAALSKAPMRLQYSCYTLQQEGLEKSVKILKHSARSKIKFIRK
jgi:hypothetical protein